MKISIQILSFLACFLLALSLVSSTAFAAETGDTVRFAEAYGLELADGANQRVTFVFPRFEYEVTVDNSASMEDVIKKLRPMTNNYGYTVSYDMASGQLVVVDADNNRIDLKVLANGTELTPKPSLPGPSISGSSMSDLLTEIGHVLSTALDWVSAVADVIAANPIFLLPVVIGFIGTGVLLFRRMLNL